MPNIAEFQLKESFKQRDVEAYEVALDAINPNGLGGSAFRMKVLGDALRAAIAAGWVVSPETRHAGDIYLIDGVDVDDIDAASGYVVAAGMKVQTTWLGFMRIPNV